MRTVLKLVLPVLTVSFAVSNPVAVLAQETAPPGIVRVDDQVSTFSLDNGMDVVVIEDHRAPVVVQMVWYKAGAADEQPGVSGVAHYLEHLMFKSTKHMKSGEFSKTVAANGGRDNAFTTQDYTAYFQRVATDRLELMMKMEADRMVNLDLTQEGILPERKVILEERNMRTENDPGALYGEQARAALYLNHPYGTPIIGWRREMETLSLQNVEDFYDKFYAPNNAILIVAGDVEPDKVKSLAETYYGVIPAKADLPERMRPQEPPQIASRHLLFEDARVAQPYVSRDYLAAERDSGDQRTAAALMLGAQLLGGGQTSYLTQRLQFDQQRSVYTNAYYRATALDDTSFSVINVPAPGITLQEAEADLDKALADFLAAPVDQAHLDRIKMNVRAQQIYSRDNVQGVARRYGSALASGLTVKDVQEWPDIVQSITPEDIKTAMAEVLTPNTSVTGWIKAPDHAKVEATQ